MRLERDGLVMQCCIKPEEPEGSRVNGGRDQQPLLTPSTSLQPFAVINTLQRVMPNQISLPNWSVIRESSDSSLLLRLSQWQWKAVPGIQDAAKQHGAASKSRGTKTQP
ncbi:hypothetical protein ACFX13_046638 [Malus domestica]